ncbi:hypothetical protein, partial [Deinococcus pimensis]|uniref:hypothetical protein n=1 Tax=Deinococcus pimensis TaxID=309888 RepID=UPI0005EB8C0D
MSRDDRRWTLGEIVDVLGRSRFRPQDASAPFVLYLTLRWNYYRLTSREVLTVACDLTRALDPQARLVWLTSGDGTSAWGRSFGWTMTFVLPGARAEATFDLREGAYADPPALLLRERVVRVDDVSPTGQILTHEGVLDADVLRRVAEERLARPALPEVLRDSPEVMSAFAELGADLHEGGAELNL